MRATIRGCLFAILAASCLAAGPALAQQEEPADSAEPLPAPHHHGHGKGPNPSLREVSPPTDRRGAWVGLGLGAGSESFRYSGTLPGYGPSLTKPTLSLKAGGTLGDHFRLGGELFGWFNQEGNILESVTSLLVIGQLYPLSHAGLFFKAGAGVGRYGVDYVNGPPSGDLGWAGVVGAGYEFRVARRVWLTPTVDLHYSYFSGRTFQSYHERVVSFGMSILVQDK